MPTDEHNPEHAADCEDAAAPLRLRSVGSGFERLLIGSGELDSPTADARERAHAAAQRALDTASARKRERKWAAALFIAAGVVVSIAVAVVWAVAEPPQVAVVPRAEPLPPVVHERPPTTPANSLPACRKVMAGAGLDPMIDDFEDGNARLLLREGRGGAWMSHGAADGKQIPSPGSTAFPVRSSGRAGRYALRMRTERLTSAAAGLNADLAPGHCYDASAYAGIEFWAKGSGRIFFGPTMIDIMEKKWGGLCEQNCYDRHQAPADLGAEWRSYRFLWKDLEQGGWGHQVPFDPRRLLSLGFSVEAPDTPSEFWIDDVRFIPR